jgi:L-ascorbate metabolism protein UlaG (beta-lactamase superfamily)
MIINKFEQSGFIITTSQGYNLAIDIGSYTPAHKIGNLKDDNVKIDAMLVSHIHGDHFSIETIEALGPKKLYLNEECVLMLGERKIPSEIIPVAVGDHIDIDGIQVQFFDVDHGPNVKVRPKENFGFLIKADGQQIYFAGDMFSPSGIAVDDLEVEHALIPVGSFYTFGPKEAHDFVKKFKHIGKVTPMHYEKNPETKTEFENLLNADN